MKPHFLLNKVPKAQECDATKV